MSSLASLSTSDRVWLIGDSNGVLIKPYLAKKARESGVVFGGSPVGGSSVISWSRELAREKWLMRAFKPTLIIVVLGANDACMTARVVANEPPFLERLLAQLSKTNARIIWLGPPKIGSVEPQVCQRMKDCLARAVPGLEAFKAMIVASGTTYLDGRDAGVEMDPVDLLHPTVRGRGAWANWIWGELSRCPGPA